jgi:hypothetical protein
MSFCCLILLFSCSAKQTKIAIEAEYRDMPVEIVFSRPVKRYDFWHGYNYRSFGTIAIQNTTDIPQEVFFVDITSDNMYLRCSNIGLAVMKYANKSLEPREKIVMEVKWDRKEASFAFFNEFNISLLARPYILGDKIDNDIEILSINTIENESKKKSKNK